MGISQFWFLEPRRGRGRLLRRARESPVLRFHAAGNDRTRPGRQQPRVLPPEPHTIIIYYSIQRLDLLNPAPDAAQRFVFGFFLALQWPL